MLGPRSPAQNPVSGLEPGPATPAQSPWPEPFHCTHPHPLPQPPHPCPLVAGRGLVTNGWTEQGLWGKKAKSDLKNVLKAREAQGKHQNMQKSIVFLILSSGNVFPLSVNIHCIHSILIKCHKPNISLKVQNGNPWVFGVCVEY